MSMSKLTIVFAVAASLFLATLPELASARPLYFQTLVSKYSIMEGDDLYACGVCHLKWLGTGQRNDYGNAVEQQLYVGRSISDALDLIEDDDADGDTFSNVDELVSFLTLPGYNCDNFDDAAGAPQGYDTYVTPGVDTCLEPRDIRVRPGSVSLITRVGETDLATFTIFNNGAEEPLHIDSVDFVNPTVATLIGPTPPYDIPVGGSAEYQVEYSPVAQTLDANDIRIVSDDPDVDEQEYDLRISFIAFNVTLAPAAERAQCFTAMAKEFGRYSKTHLSEWSRCHFDELEGVICDAGRRDFKVDRSQAKFESVIGGDKDQDCEGINMTRSLLDYPDTCGGGCSDLDVATFGAIPACLECRQNEVMQSQLTLLTGSAPPDLPAEPIADEAVHSCVKKLDRTVQKAISKMFRAHTECEIEGVAAETTPDCATTLAADDAKLIAKVDKQKDKCVEVVGLGCVLDGEGGSSCDSLGPDVTGLAQELVRALMGQADPEEE